MMRAQGVVSEADRLFDCDFFTYYWRIVGYNAYVEAQNKAIKEQTRK